MALLSGRARRAAALGVLAFALAVGGCGRRGKLEPPPDPSNPFALGADPEPAAAPAGNQDASQSRPIRHRRPKNSPIKPPNEPFILDPLL